MGSARVGALLWPGMILAGLALAAAVLAAWPEPTERIVRLPYGESQPKAPARELEATAARVTTSAASHAPAVPDGPSSPPPAREAEEPARVLAAVEPTPQTEEYDASDGPPPVPSDTELDDGYVQESPEELGAEPLPGAEPPAPTQPPVAG